MSQAFAGIPFDLIDDPRVKSDHTHLWSRLEVLRIRQRSNVIQTLDKYLKLCHLSGFQWRKVFRLMKDLTEFGYLEPLDEGRVRLLAGEKYSGIPVAVPEAVPIPEAEPTTTSVDSDESQDAKLDAELIKDAEAEGFPDPSKQVFADSVFDNWKAFAEWANSEGAFSQRVAAPRKSTQSIRRKILARFKDPPWQGEYWPPMLEKLKTLKPHWRGEGDWVINLEYLVRNDGQAEKLLNGQWSEAAPKSTEVTQADIQEGLAAMDKMEKETPW